VRRVREQGSPGIFGFSRSPGHAQTGSYDRTKSGRGRMKEMATLLDAARESAKTGKRVVLRGR
jgi:hypothetical protein